MAEEIVKTIFLIRTKVPVTRKGASGERGKLLVGGVTYHTIERRGGYVTLPVGIFEIKMEYSPSRTVKGQPRKQFRIYGHNVKNNKGNSAALLIHAGNYPNEVTGCVAPGKTVKNNGILQSSTAMKEIFNYLGGFKIGQKAKLVVEGPQDELTNLQKFGDL